MKKLTQHTNCHSCTDDVFLHQLRMALRKDRYRWQVALGAWRNFTEIKVSSLGLILALIIYLKYVDISPPKIRSISALWQIHTLIGPHIFSAKFLHTHRKAVPQIFRKILDRSQYDLPPQYQYLRLMATNIYELRQYFSWLFEVFQDSNEFDLTQKNNKILGQ